MPFGKLLFASDAYGLAEHYLLGAHIFRRSLTHILSALADAGEMTAADAAHVGALVVRENARRVYGLESTEVDG